MACDYQDELHTRVSDDVVYALPMSGEYDSSRVRNVRALAVCRSEKPDAPLVEIDLIPVMYYCLHSVEYVYVAYILINNN